MTKQTLFIKRTSQGRNMPPLTLSSIQ